MWLGFVRPFLKNATDFLVSNLNFPLKAAPGYRPGAALKLVSFIFLTAFAARAPVRLGTVQAGFGVTRAGVCLGSLLISTPGRALRPGSQAGLRRLIIFPGRVSAGGLVAVGSISRASGQGRKRAHFATSSLRAKPKGRLCAGPFEAAPRRWHSRSPQEAAAPYGLWRALQDARLSGWLPVLLV